MTVYASENDRALLASKMVRQRAPRLGDVEKDGPVVVEGVDTIDASEVSTDLFGLNHSYYAESSTIVTDIGQLFLRGVRPPDIRNPILRSVVKPDGEIYWKMPPT